MFRLVMIDFTTVKNAKNVDQAAAAPSVTSFTY